MIALFSFDDLEMRNCKSGQWWLTNPHFARANNSAIAPYQEITESMFKTFWQDVENAKAGDYENMLHKTTNEARQFNVNASKIVAEKQRIDEALKAIDDNPAYTADDKALRKK